MGGIQNFDQIPVPQRALRSSADPPRDAFSQRPFKFPNFTTLGGRRCTSTFFRQHQRGWQFCIVVIRLIARFSRIFEVAGRGCRDRASPEGGFWDSTVPKAAGSVSILFLVDSPQSICELLGSQSIVAGTEAPPQMRAEDFTVSSAADSMASCKIRVSVKLIMASTATIHVSFAGPETRLDIVRFARKSRR